MADQTNEDLPNEDLPVLTAQQTAAELDIRLETFYRKAGRGEIEGARKVGGIWLVERDAVKRQAREGQSKELQPA
jgi:hypothetical protein